MVEFLDEKISNGELRRGVDYDKNKLHTEFLEKYPEFKEDRWLKRTANFTKYLKTYANFSPELKSKQLPKETRSNGKSYIQFIKNEETQSDLPF